MAAHSRSVTAQPTENLVATARSRRLRMWAKNDFVQPAPSARVSSGTLCRCASGI